jgi:outer membrane protein assembly factor BamB
MSTQNGGLISLATWFDLLSDADKAAVTPEYRARFDADAKDALDAVRRNPGYGVEDLYAVARHYPLSHAAGEALALAADRAMQSADAAAGLTLYSLAEHAGWTLEPAQAARVEALKPLVRGRPLSPDGGGAALEDGAGAVPFDAPWYGNAAAFAEPRFFPLFAEKDALLIGPRSVVRANETGPVWSWNAAAAPAGQATPPAPLHTHERNGDLMPDPPRRGSVYAGAELMDVYGHAQLLIVRQPTERPDQFTLRGFSISDGRLLWDTQSQGDLHDQSITGAPAVCGQYTYATALNVNTSIDRKTGIMENATLSLLAMDTVTGQLLWQCAVGSYSATRKHGRMPGIFPWADAWEHAEPAVAGDALYLTPAPGTAVCVGRFDGKIRWLRPYGPEPAVEVPHDRQSRLAMQNAVADPKLALRYRDTPAISGNVVVIAPFDALPAYGLDRASGQELWENAELAGATVLGATANAVLLQGKSILSIEASTGKTIWSWEPQPGAITGPAILRGGAAGEIVRVPATEGEVMVSAATGLRVDRAPALLDFRKFLKSEGGKKALEATGAAKGFGAPAP